MSDQARQAILILTSSGSVCSYFLKVQKVGYKVWAGNTGVEGKRICLLSIGFHVCYIKLILAINMSVKILLSFLHELN